jgi:hypothetical protein
MAALSMVAAFGQAWILRRAGEPLSTLLLARWPILLVLVYLPALVLVLRLPRAAPQGASLDLGPATVERIPA